MTTKLNVTHTLLAAAVAGTVLFSGLFGSARAVAATSQLSGSGSSFDAAFFNAGFAAYAKSSGVSITYSAAGSGVGVAQFTANKVDFGATDVPMTAIEAFVAAGNGGPVLQMPVVLGAVAVVFDLPAIGSHTLQLDGPTLARIYLGQITSWNDPAITSLNPSISLPSTRIVPVHRLDHSGTTNTFTDYLTKVSIQWASTMGRGLTVPWRSGIAATGGSGMAKAIAGTTGAIGYVDLSTAIKNKLTYVALKNQANSYQLPTHASVAAAAASFPNVTSTNYSITNAPGQLSYPLATYSWVLLRQHSVGSGRGAAIVKLFRWMTGPGQSLANSLNYVALPEAMQAVDTQSLSTIRVAASQGFERGDFNVQQDLHASVAPRQLSVQSHPAIARLRASH